MKAHRRRDSSAKRKAESTVFLTVTGNCVAMKYRALNAHDVSECRICDVIGMNVKFKNKKTNRMKSGKIRTINNSGAIVYDGENVGRWILWDEIYVEADT